MWFSSWKFVSPLWQGGGCFQRVQHCQLFEKELGFEDIFVYGLIVKFVHFIYIDFLWFFLFFYTYYSVESSGYIENALYFSISQMNYCHPQDFSCTYFVHLGPKTANRIPIFPLTVLILPSSLLYSNINVDSLFIFLWSEYWEYSLVKSIFPKSRTVRSFN